MCNVQKNIYVIKLEWFIYVHRFSCSGIRKMNIFNHFRFKECTIKHLKECLTKEEFAERISRELFYYFGSKTEYELMITRKDNKLMLSPWIGNKEGILDVTDGSDFDWKGFYEKMDQRYRKFEDSIKFDVNDQVHYNFENFVDYCWNSKVHISNI